MTSGTVFQTAPQRVEIEVGQTLVVSSLDVGSSGKLWISDIAGREVPGLISIATNSTKVIGPFPNTRRVSIEPDVGSLFYDLRAFGYVSIYGSPGSATVGQPFAFAPTAQGGVAPLSFALTGTLPAGLVFTTATGLISGIPTSAGTTVGLNISATDGFQTVSLGVFSLIVVAGALPAFGVADFSNSANSGLVTAIAA